MAKWGERASPPCPRCKRRLRIKQGTKPTTLGEKLRFQCGACIVTHPDCCEWYPAIVAMLNEMKANGAVLTEEDF